MQYPLRPEKPLPADLGHQVLVCNSEDSKNCEFEPRLLDHGEGLFVKEKEELILFDSLICSFKKCLNNWYVYLHGLP